MLWLKFLIIFQIADVVKIYLSEQGIKVQNVLLFPIETTKHYIHKEK